MPSLYLRLENTLQTDYLDDLV